MSPSHPLTLKDVQRQVQVKVVERHLQPTGRASGSSWAGKAGHSALSSKAGQASSALSKAGHSALSSKAGQGRAAQAQVAAGCCKACQPQHGRDKKSQALHLSFTSSLSLAVSLCSYCWPKCRLISVVFAVRCAKAFPRGTTTIAFFVLTI